MPGKFIPVLEAANFTYKLDIYIIRQIARDFRKCIEEGTPIVPVSFNFSRTDFETCNPYEELQKAVKEYNLEPKMFRVEITESTLMSDPAKIKEQMTLFRKAGYEVLMDDFGSAYSSLATLRDFDFDEIKIDMGFMRNFSDKSKKIIRPMIMLRRGNRRAAQLPPAGWLRKDPGLLLQQTHSLQRIRPETENHGLL